LFLRRFFSRSRRSSDLNFPPARLANSLYDYSEFAKRAGGKFKSELLLEREKNRLKNKPA